MFSGRVFPTHVGMNRVAALFYPYQFGIPHARGDEPDGHGTNLAPQAYSPRTWG